MNDLFNKLDEGPQNRPFEVWGQVAMDVFEAILVKGYGKKPFDPNTDDPNKKVIAIKLEVQPLTEMGNVFTVLREMIDQSKEWGLTLSSFKNLGVTSANLPGAWCRIVTAPTGETYVNKNGETKDKTHIKFLAFFADRGACLADYQASGFAQAQAAPAQAAPVQTQAATPGNGGGNGSKLNLSAFLKPLAQNAARGETDIEKILEKMGVMIAGMPQLAPHFTKDSPEVIEAVTNAMFPG